MGLLWAHYYKFYIVLCYRWMLLSVKASLNLLFSQIQYFIYYAFFVIQRMNLIFSVFLLKKSEALLISSFFHWFKYNIYISWIIVLFKPILRACSKAFKMNKLFRSFSLYLSIENTIFVYFMNFVLSYHYHLVFMMILNLN